MVPGRASDSRRAAMLIASPTASLKLAFVTQEHVAKVNADPHLQARAHEFLGIDAAQDGEAGIDGGDDRIEGGEHGIARPNLGLAAGVRHEGAQHLVQPVDRLRGALVVLADQGAVAAHVGQAARRRSGG